MISFVLEKPVKNKITFINPFNIAKNFPCFRKILSDSFPKYTNITAGVNSPQANTIIAKYALVPVWNDRSTPKKGSVLN